MTGCTKVGPGCDNCYAERFAERWRGIAGHPYEQGFDLTLWPSRLKQPVLWKKPRMIFVNSMSDRFHKDIERKFIDAVFDAMEQADWHVYQVLTKPSSLMRNYVRKRYDGGPVPRHIWLGVSVEDAAHTSRIEHLKQINSDARFISFEPLLGPIGDVDLRGVAWAIVGGGRAGLGLGPWTKAGHANFVTSATVTTWRSSSSNGVAHGRSRVGVCSTAKSGTAFLGRSSPNQSFAPCSQRKLDAASDRKLPRT